MSDKSKPTIAITGAGGFLGSELTRYFAAKGWEVRALVRNPDKYTVSGRISYYGYDITAKLPASTLKDVDYLVHAAYIKHDRSSPDAIDANIKGASRLLAASRAAGVKRNIFISSMSSHADALSAYGRQKFAIEKLFNTGADLSIRPGLIIGNGGIVRSMADFMKSKHLVPLIGGGRQPLQIVSIHDLGKVLERSIEFDKAGVMTIAHPHIYSYREFYRLLSRHIGVRVFFLPVPFWILFAVLRTAEVLHLPLNIGTDNLLGLKKLRSADTTSDLQKLGIELEDLPAALKGLSL